jgi:hypothetical protein
MPGRIPKAGRLALSRVVYAQSPTFLADFPYKGALP